MKGFFLATVASILLFVPRVGFADDRLKDTETDPAKILDVALKNDDSTQSSATTKMTIQQGKDQKRVREFQSKVRSGDGVRKTLVIFTSPADIRNTGLLTLDYLNDQKPDGQWLYLPALKRTTRISAKTQSKSFMGSDFSYADLSSPTLQNYTLKLLDGNAKANNEVYWQIEMIPKTPEEFERTGYEKSEIWISKKTETPFRAKSWMKRGRLKYIEWSNVKKIDGKNVPTRIVARTVDGDKLMSETVIEQLDLRPNDKSISDAEFTASRLEQGL
ncbi:MAG: outer membrane lipoprotein-sorting protein [Polyangiales bacterium]